jgi:hypothetical protein
MMAVKTSVVVSVFGFLLIITGVAFWMSNLEMHNYCMNDTVRSGLMEECQSADWYMVLGLAWALVGLVIFLIGGAFALAWNPKPERKHFSCPHCDLHIYYETSPTNCIYCGLPVNWYRERDQVKYARP